MPEFGMIFRQSLFSKEVISMAGFASWLRNIKGGEADDRSPPPVPAGLHKAGRDLAIKGIVFPRERDTGLLGDYREGLLKWRVSLVQKLQDEFEALENTINNLALSFTENNFVDKLDKPIRSLEANCKKQYRDSDIEGGIAEFSDERKTLQVFVRENDLLKLPRNAHKSGWKYFLVLAALVILEAIFNGLILSDARGGRGALGISLPAAALNVISGYLAGRFVLGTILYHMEKIWRTFGLLAMAAYVCIVLYLNFVLGMLRSLLSSSGMEFQVAIREALHIFSASNWEKLDALSVIFIGIGIIFSIAALIDGWLSDDPCPGYGAAWRKCGKAHKKAEKALKNLRDDTHGACNSAESRQENEYESLQADITRWSESVNTLQRRFQDYRDMVVVAVDNWATANERFVAGYRDKKGPSSDIANNTATLFSENHSNPHEVFGDVKHVYLDDEERIQKADKYHEILSKIYGQEKQNLIDMQKSLRKKVDGINVPPVTIGDDAH